MKSNNKNISVLIIEDEPYAQIELKRLLKNCGYNINILDCIDSVEDAIIWLKNSPNPDLIFLDIQLSDGISFEIFNHITIETPIIFTTAFDEYAIRAFKLNSIDYLLKPVKQHDLDASIKKYDAIYATNSKESFLNEEQIENILKINKSTYKSRFMIRLGDQIKYVPVENIAYFKSENNEVMLVTDTNRRYIIDYTLEQLPHHLDPKLFFRATRSYVINISAITKINKYFNSRIHIQLEPKTDDDVLISRVRVPDFLNWIDK